MASDGRNGSGGKFISYFERRQTRRGVATPHLMEELNKPKTDVPRWTSALAPFGFAAVMVAVGVACGLMGSPVLGVVFAVLGILPTAAVVAMAWQALPRVLGPRRDASLEELGPYLGGGGDQRVREMSRGLAQQEHDVLEWNRAEEASRTWEWLQALGCPVERVEASAEDGATLVGRVIACRPDSPRWVIFAHGFDDTWRAGLTYARRYCEAGYNLLLVDLRAHGESGGSWVGAGWLDRRDLVTWSRWLAGRVGSGAAIALAGISMGGASCIMAAAEADLSESVRAVVADSAYSDFWNTAVGVVSRGTLGTQPMPAHPLLDLARLLLKLDRGGYDLASSRPVDAIARSRVPVLLLQGEDDRVVPPHMSDALAAAAGGEAAGDGCELVKFPSAGHCCAVFADPGRYWDTVRGFLGTRL